MNIFRDISVIRRCQALFARLVLEKRSMNHTPCCSVSFSHMSMQLSAEFIRLPQSEMGRSDGARCSLSSFVLSTWSTRSASRHSKRRGSTPNGGRCGGFAARSGTFAVTTRINAFRITRIAIPRSTCIAACSGNSYLWVAFRADYRERALRFGLWVLTMLIYLWKKSCVWPKSSNKCCSPLKEELCLS